VYQKSIRQLVHSLFIMHSNIQHIIFYTNHNEIQKCLFCRVSNNRDYSNHKLHNIKRLARNSFVPTIVYVEEKTKAKVLVSQNLRQFG